MSIFIHTWDAILERVRLTLLGLRRLLDLDLQLIEPEAKYPILF
jgi:hypothetical protein